MPCWRNLCPPIVGRASEASPDSLDWLWSQEHVPEKLGLTVATADRNGKDRPLMADKTWCFEDFHVGLTKRLGALSLTSADIAAFADEFDPDPARAEGDAASGWHVASAFMRLFYDGLLAQSTSLGSPGIEWMNWGAPVHAGETIVAGLEVVEVKPSRSKPSIGLVRFRFLVTGPEAATVMTGESWSIFGRREVSA